LKKAAGRVSIFIRGKMKNINYSIAVILLLFAGFLTVSTIFLSCKKEKTYILEVKDGVKYIHNLKPQHDHPTAGLEFVQQIGELEPEDENYLFSFPISVAEDEEGNIYIMDIKEC
jgi:hypothetical protein